MEGGVLFLVKLQAEEEFVLRMIPEFAMSRYLSLLFCPKNRPFSWIRGAVEKSVP